LAEEDETSGSKELHSDDDDLDSDSGSPSGSDQEMSILDRSEILNLIGMENAIIRDKIVDQEILFEKKLAEAIDSILFKIEISRK
jgi:hypothetical protein